MLGAVILKYLTISAALLLPASGLAYMIAVYLDHRYQSRWRP